MVTYYVEKDEIYKVSATVNCAVYDASGSTIATCDAGSIVTFKAPTDKILISDNNAALNCISETSGDLSGLTEHVNNSAIHVTAQEKANWNSVVDSVTVDNAKFEEHMVNTTIHLTEDKVVSMLNEELYTQGEYRTTYGSDNFNAHAFEIAEPPIGEISQIAMPCRSASGNVGTMYVDAPVYLSIFEKDANGTWQHVGTSTNSNTQTSSTTAYYQFDNLTLSGRAIRVIVVTDNTSTDFDASLVIGARVTAVPDKGIAYTNAALSGKQEYMIDLTFTGKNIEVKYAPSSHVGDNTHVTADERTKWDFTAEHADIVWDLNKMFPDEGTAYPDDAPDGQGNIWLEYEGINRLRAYFYAIDAANGDTDPETGFTYSKKYMKPGLKVRFRRQAREGYIPNAIMATHIWCGGAIDWTWNPETNWETNHFDDFSYPMNWEFEVTEEMLDAHVDNADIHITAAEREAWNAALSGGTSDSGTSSFEELNVKTLHVDDIDINSPLNGDIDFNDSVIFRGSVVFSSAGTVRKSSNTTTAITDADVLNKSECDSLYAAKNYGTANAVLITDANGNITASTIISVSELNTLNNNLTNLATKLADLESRLAALETA